MSREVKEYTVRKNEILDTAQNLFLTKGYRNTSVRDIINTIGIAKGTFYHYFKSKEQLMKEIVDRIIGQSVTIYSSYAKYNELKATEKLNGIFKKIWEWRLDNKELKVLRSVFQEINLNNDIWNYLRRSSIKRATPILADIIKEGVDEGNIINDYPLETGEIVLNLIFDLKESVGRFLADKRKSKETVNTIIRRIEAFNFSIERILGIEPGSLMVNDNQKIKTFMESEV